MARLDRGNHFLSGFGNENFIEEFYMDRTDGLKPSTVLSENEEQYMLEVGLPFLEKEDIHLTLNGNELSISGKKKINEKKFLSVFFIPNDVRFNAITADFKDGLLTLTFPKTKVQKETYVIRLN